MEKWDLLDASGNPVDWAPQGQKVFSIVDAKKNPDHVYEGRYALKQTVPKDLASTHGVRSELIPIQPGVTYKLSLYAKEGEVGSFIVPHIAAEVYKIGPNFRRFHIKSPLCF